MNIRDPQVSGGSFWITLLCSTENTTNGCFQLIWTTITLGERIDHSPAMHLTIGLCVPPNRRRSSTSQLFTGAITTTYPRLHEFSGPTVVASNGWLHRDTTLREDGNSGKSGAVHQVAKRPQFSIRLSTGHTISCLP